MKVEQVRYPDDCANRHDRWVAMWREAVRTSPLATGLVELSTKRFVEMSDRATELLHLAPGRGAGVSYLTVTERPVEATQTFRLVQEGMVDGLEGRRRYQSPDGSTVELQVSGWAVRSSTGLDLGLWIASEADHPAPGGAVAAVSPPGSHGAFYSDGARITLDDRWRIANISTNARAVLGRAPAEFLASSILELTHPGDLAVLLLAFARATTESSSDVQIRLRESGGWRTIRAVITLLEGDGTMPFSLIATPAGEPSVPAPNVASQLADQLRYIASQIEAAGILAPLAQPGATLRVPASTELSARQREIASRLGRGERVATIADEMYLSQSTVRNHLSAIFQKFGVHSQHELLAVWRNGARRQSPTG
jgi:DNA-binding CsgD family transcriptional regulator